MFLLLGLGLLLSGYCWPVYFRPPRRPTFPYICYVLILSCSFWAVLQLDPPVAVLNLWSSSSLCFLSLVILFLIPVIPTPFVITIIPWFCFMFPRVMLILYVGPICLSSDHIHWWVWGSVFQRGVFSSGALLFSPEGTSYSSWQCIWGEEGGQRGSPTVCLSGWIEGTQQCSMSSAEWRTRGRGWPQAPGVNTDSSPPPEKSSGQSFTFSSQH